MSRPVVIIQFKILQSLLYLVIYCIPLKHNLLIHKPEGYTSVAHTQMLNNRPETAAHRASQSTSSQHFPLVSSSRRAAKGMAATQTVVFLKE